MVCVVVSVMYVCLFVICIIRLLLLLCYVWLDVVCGKCVPVLLSCLMPPVAYVPPNSSCSWDEVVCAIQGIPIILLEGTV